MFCAAIVQTTSFSMLTRCTTSDHYVHQHRLLLSSLLMLELIFSFPNQWLCQRCTQLRHIGTKGCGGQWDQGRAIHKMPTDCDKNEGMYACTYPVQIIFSIQWQSYQQRKKIWTTISNRFFFCTHYFCFIPCQDWWISLMFRYLS